jgi:hypothetical protein
MGAFDLLGIKPAISILGMGRQQVLPLLKKRIVRSPKSVAKVMQGAGVWCKFQYYIYIYHTMKR